MMETTALPVQRAPKRLWSPEKKMAVLQAWQDGTPLEEVCRTHGVHASQVYKWKRALDRGLQDRGALVPKSQVIALQKRIEELERALGRKTLELDVLKKAYALKGLKLPEGMCDG